MEMLRCFLALLLTISVAVTGASDSAVELKKEIAELRAELRAMHAEMHEVRTENTKMHHEMHEEVRAEVAAAETEAAGGRRLTAAAVATLTGDMTHAWLILCGALVMFMHAGFTMLETGSCRAKNASNVLMKNLVNVSVGTIAWYLLGYAFAYGGVDGAPDKLEGDGGNEFIGTAGFAASGFNKDEDGGNIVAQGVTLEWFFQWAFCTAGATIVSGAVAERVLSPAYAAYAFVMAGFIYPVVVAWTWGYGWINYLFDIGVIDFAGSGIVHLTGGVAGLAGTVVLGPRKGRFENPDAFAPHSMPLLVLGTFILWFGWYGFNCGSTLAMGTGEGPLAAQVAMNTTISAATGGIVVFFLRYAITKLYDVGGLCNGILGGLVAITAPCGNVEAGSAFTIGLIGAFVYQGSSMLLQKLKIDDPVDAVPVHGFCGIWGVLAAALFDWGKGFDEFHGWSGFSCVQGDDGACATGLAGKALGAHIVMIIVIILWSGILSGITFFVLMKTGYLRIDEQTEDSGVDAAKHSPGKAYTMGDAAPPAAI